MGLFDNFPYTNLHEINLDWILNKLGLLNSSVESAEASASAASSSESAASVSAKAAAESEAAAENFANIAEDFAISGDRFVVIGDSYGVGYTPDSASYIKAWPAYVKEFLAIPDNAWNVSCEGGAGFCNPGNQTGKKFVGLMQTVPVSSPDTITKIIVVGGYNDQSYDISEITSAINTFCNVAKSRFPKARVYIGSVARNVSETHSLQLVNNLYKVYIAFKLQKDAIYLTGVEMSDRDISLFSSDGYHPNELGQSVIGFAVANAIKTGSYMHTRDFINLSLTGGEGSANFEGSVAQNGNNLFFYCPTVTITNLSKTGNINGINVNLGKINAGPLSTGIRSINFKLTGFCTCTEGTVPCEMAVFVNADRTLSTRVRAYNPTGSGFATNLSSLSIQANTVTLPTMFF